MDEWHTGAATSAVPSNRKADLGMSNQRAISKVRLCLNCVVEVSVDLLACSSTLHIQGALGLLHAIQGDCVAELGMLEYNLGGPSKFRAIMAGMEELERILYSTPSPSGPSGRDSSHHNHHRSEHLEMCKETTKSEDSRWARVPSHSDDSQGATGMSELVPRRYLRARAPGASTLAETGRGNGFAHHPYSQPSRAMPCEAAQNTWASHHVYSRSAPAYTHNWDARYDGKVAVRHHARELQHSYENGQTVGGLRQFERYGSSLSTSMSYSDSEQIFHDDDNDDDDNDDDDDDDDDTNNMSREQNIRGGGGAGGRHPARGGSISGDTTTITNPSSYGQATSLWESTGRSKQAEQRNSLSIFAGLEGPSPVSPGRQGVEVCPRPSPVVSNKGSTSILDSVKGYIKTRARKLASGIGRFARS